MLELLKLPGMGPKSVALFWEVLQVADIDQLEAAIAAGQLAELPRFGEKAAEKLKKGIAEYRKNSGRFHLDDAETAAAKITEYLFNFPESPLSPPPAHSVAAATPSATSISSPPAPVATKTKSLPPSTTWPPIRPSPRSSPKAPNKVSFRLSNSLQVDVRLLPEASYGAALQYFTGSKMHNVSTRQRALNAATP